MNKYLNFKNKVSVITGAGSGIGREVSIKLSNLGSTVILIGRTKKVTKLEKKIGKKIAASRFRANLLIDDINPWKEFDWVGKKIKIGESVLEVFKRTQRCAATNVNPENAIRDINIPNEINSYFGHLDLGVYAKVKKTGVISVNDKLSLN